MGLTTLLRDSIQARDVINKTMTDATKKHLLSFKHFYFANKALISAGVNINKSREDVLNLANAIVPQVVVMTSYNVWFINLQQIKNTGQATALDLKQFVYAGINLYKVLEEGGIKVDQK